MYSLIINIEIEWWYFSVIFVIKVIQMDFTKMNSLNVLSANVYISVFQTIFSRELNY